MYDFYRVRVCCIDSVCGGPFNSYDFFAAWGTGEGKSLSIHLVPIQCEGGLIDRELARFIYVREVKRFDPFKFSIYAWYIKIAIAGSLTPVRLAWVPFLRVPKNGFIYVEADTKKLYAGL